MAKPTIEAISTATLPEFAAFLAANMTPVHTGERSVSYTHLDVYKRQAMDWLDSSQRGGCVALLGVRLGAPLAAEVLNERPGRRTGRCV